MFGKTLIISGGKTDICFARKYLSENLFNTIVCADSGLNVVDALGIVPDYFMGDFDSVSEDVLEKYMLMASGENLKEVEKGVLKENSKKIPTYIKYPAQKDATDTQLVLEFVISHSPTEIVILGATGGRLDHLIANINILILPLKEKIPTYIVDKYNLLWLTDTNCHIKKKDAWGKYISFQPLTEKVSNIRLRGVKYPLDGKDVFLGDSLTVSNEFAEDSEAAEVLFDDGILIITESGD